MPQSCRSASMIELGGFYGNGLWIVDLVLSIPSVFKGRNLVDSKETLQCFCSGAMVWWVWGVGNKAPDQCSSVRRIFACFDPVQWRARAILRMDNKISLRTVSRSALAFILISNTCLILFTIDRTKHSIQQSRKYVIGTLSRLCDRHGSLASVLPLKLC